MSSRSFTLLAIRIRSKRQLEISESSFLLFDWRLPIDFFSIRFFHIDTPNRDQRVVTGFFFHLRKFIVLVEINRFYRSLPECNEKLKYILWVPFEMVNWKERMRNENRCRCIVAVRSYLKCVRVWVNIGSHEWKRKWLKVYSARKANKRKKMKTETESHTRGNNHSDIGLIPHYPKAK